MRCDDATGPTVSSMQVARSWTGHQDDVVPELPDLAILADAFTAALAGRNLVDHDVRQPLVLRGTGHELASLHGQVLRGVTRRGKFLTLRLDSGRVVVNAMLTGRLGLGQPGSRTRVSTAVAISFGPREPGSRGHPEWTLGAPWLPPDDETVELRYRDPARMGKVYLLPEGVERGVPGWDEQGPDIDDPGLDLTAWRSRIARYRGELKNLLRNQAFVAGIGNAYSDEILWAARLSPFRSRPSLADEETDRLWHASREVCRSAIAYLRERVPPHFEIEVRDHLQVHGKGGQPCPRCGATLSQVSPGGPVTTWCRTCQP